MGEERVFCKYPTGCWLGVCVGRGVAYQYPSVCCFGGWEEGILKVSNWFLVRWGGWDPNNIQMFFCRVRGGEGEGGNLSVCN